MRARHVVTFGICVGAAGAGALLFAGCGTDTFGTCADKQTCVSEGGVEGGLKDGTAGDTGETDSAHAEGSTGEGGKDGGEGGVLPEAGCSAPTTLECNGSCVDPTTTANCGTCGNVCFGPEAGPGHASCMPGGHCAVACDSDGGDAGTEILCSGACVSPNDPNHCGTCTTTCPAPPSGNGSATCPAAQCGVSCTTGFHGAGANCNSDCQPNGDDPSTDPCVVADGLGVFVSPTGSDTNDGSKEHPFGTLAHAMNTSARVYACGTFAAEPQPLTVTGGTPSDGTSVFGGFDCATWTYTAGTKTKLAPTTPGIVLVVNGLTKGVTFEDFEFDAVAAPSTAVAGQAGASSQAVIVNTSVGVVFRRVAITAGAGQPGGKGADGANSWSGSAESGSPASGTTAGEFISCSCGGTGGQGGSAGSFNAGTDQFSPGGDGQDGTPVGVTNHGSGITQIGAGNACTAGDPTGVAAGGAGPGGAGGAGTGAIAYPAGWSNSEVAGPGGPGGTGQGGGGGGGYFYVIGAPPNGAGGGGGCGGCGGVQGSGGYAGGSSIALIAIGSSIVLDASTLTAASGGVGGSGGSGQNGQTGGGGGSGAGTGSCAGGAGGAGGEGGAGGGGVGGNSLAVAYHGTIPSHVGTVTEDVATAAAGGSPGGGNSTATSQGNPGLSVAEQLF